MSPPLSANECLQTATSAYADVQRFLQSPTFLSTGAAAFGWRDRRRLTGDRLQFSLQKRFHHTSPYVLAQRSWDVFASCEQHAALYTTSLRVRFVVPQVVDADHFVVLRVLSRPDGDVVAKSLFLISRLYTDRGPVVLFRSVDQARLRTHYADSLLRDDDDGDRPVHWLQDVLTWSVHWMDRRLLSHSLLATEWS